MPISDKDTPGGTGVPTVPDAKAFSRRDFLRVAGLSGASIGLAAGLGEVLSACGQATTTTTTTAASATTTSAASSTTTSAAATTTSASAGAEAGREIKLGFVTPLTGPIALFGVPDQYCVSRWTEATSKGLVCGDGKNHPVKIFVQDSQSDANRAAQPGRRLDQQHQGGRDHGRIDARHVQPGRRPG